MAAGPCQPLGAPWDRSVEVAVGSWIVLAPLGPRMSQLAASPGLLRLAQAFRGPGHRVGREQIVDLPAPPRDGATLLRVRGFAMTLVDRRTARGIRGQRGDDDARPREDVGLLSCRWHSGLLQSPYQLASPFRRGYPGRCRTYRRQLQLAAPRKGGEVGPLLTDSVVGQGDRCVAQATQRARRPLTPPRGRHHGAAGG